MYHILRKPRRVVDSHFVHVHSLALHVHSVYRNVVNGYVQ